ncbi:MAG: hypothetical protein H0W47_03325 [Polaromonas sp.]|uniref:hypothetical protein n=1 Tax=Polaromonas sp. TaxID=1869339 RepID=UPI00183D4CC2|nr:hypothetical protein [Polaromonas sp.]MBA3592816.1 hypothetical protein [Polaromonas sp.]
MKLNQSLTAAVTAAALVAGAGFAYAQTAVTNTPGETNAQGTTTMQAQPSTGSTMQAQPSTSTGSTGSTTMDNSATTSVDTTLQPRADRN